MIYVTGWKLLLPSSYATTPVALEVSGSSKVKVLGLRFTVY